MKSNKKITLSSLNNINIINVFKLLPGHIYWKDKNGYLLGCNQEQAISLGLKNCDEIIGKTDYDFCSEAEAHELRRNDMKVMRTGLPITVEETHYLSTKIPLFHEDGSIIGLLGISLDIKQYKNQLQEQMNMLEEIIAVMPGHVYWKDKDCILQGCNDQQAIDAGFKSRYDIIGKNTFEIYKNMPDETRHIRAANVDAADIAIMESGIPRILEEGAVELDNQEVMYLSHKKPLYDCEGNVNGLLGISFDITEQKQLEQQLQQAKQEAETANKLKSEFVSNMQHDIRTPISGLKLLLSKLENTNDLDKFKRLIPRAHDAAKELLAICNEVIDFDNIAYGDKSIYVKKFSLLKLAHSVIQLNGAAALAKELKLSLQIDEAVPDIIKGDEHRLKKILINLIGNALKFTERGEVSLHVRLIRQQDTQIVIQFDIADTGIGIADTDIDNIYEKFTRLHPSHAGIFKGTGLGLHVVKTYVDELGGDIDVISQLDLGSHFVVTLPFELPLTAMPTTLSELSGHMMVLNIV